MKVVAKTKRQSTDPKQEQRFLCVFSNGKRFECSSLDEANSELTMLHRQGKEHVGVVIKDFYELRPIVNLVEQQKAAARMKEIADLRARRETLVTELEEVRKKLKKLGLKR